MVPTFVAVVMIGVPSKSPVLLASELTNKKPFAAVGEANGLRAETGIELGVLMMCHCSGLEPVLPIVQLAAEEKLSDQMVVTLAVAKGLCATLDPTSKEVL